MADKRKTNSEKKQKSQAATLKEGNPPTWKIQNFSRIFNSACNCICCAYTYIFQS